MKVTDRDNYELSSGRRFSANCGIIGLSPEKLTVSEGFDGEIDIDGYPWEDFTDENRWTPAERAELADFMIAAWQRFKAATEPTAEERVHAAQARRDSMVAGTEPPG